MSFRFEIKKGNFGLHFYDKVNKKDMSLDDVRIILNTADRLNESLNISHGINDELTLRNAELIKERNEYDKRRRSAIEQATKYRDELLELKKCTKQ